MVESKDGFLVLQVELKDDPLASLQDEFRAYLRQDDYQA